MVLHSPSNTLLKEIASASRVYVCV